MVRARGVLFDIGGVIADSPIMAIRRWSVTAGVPDLNPFLGESEAWNAFMRGAIDRAAFDAGLADELAVAGIPAIDVAGLMDGTFGAQARRAADRSSGIRLTSVRSGSARRAYRVATAR
jgi:hypothetical protein